MNALRIALIAALFQTTSVQKGPSASIEGLVSDLATGQPISGAVVELTGIAAGGEYRVLSFSTLTATDGGFALDKIPPGNAYHLVVTRAPDYAPAVHGQRQPGDPWVAIPLTAGQRMTGIRIALKRFSSISGRVVNKEGKPVRGMSVAALQLLVRDGQRVLQTSRKASSNEQGEYRISGLASGRYILRMGPAPGASPYPNKATTETLNPYIYYQNALDANDSESVNVGDGVELEGMNFVAMPVATRRVRGNVSNASTGRIASEARVLLVPERASPDSPTARTYSGRGAFDFRGVAPGSYLLFAISRDETGRALFGRTSVKVGLTELRDITLSVHPGFDLEGRVSVDDPALASDIDFSQFMVMLRAESRETLDEDLHELRPPDDSSLTVPPVRSVPAKDGAFTLQGIRPWSYFAEISMKPGAAVPENTLRALQRLYVKSIHLDSVDVLRDGQPFDISASRVLNLILSSEGGELAGRVLDGNRNHIPYSTVVLVPDEPLRGRRDLYRTARTDISGGFSLQKIPPGNYKIFSWRTVDSGAWFYSEFLRAFESRGVSVIVRPSGRNYVELSLSTEPG